MIFQWFLIEAILESSHVVLQSWSLHRIHDEYADFLPSMSIFKVLFLTSVVLNESWSIRGRHV